jgi:hypothetical protein
VDLDPDLHYFAGTASKPAIPDLNAVPNLNPTHSKDSNVASTSYNYNVKA